MPVVARSEVLSETALIVRVPEAEPWVKHLRTSLDPSAALGMPAHITILFPFLPPERITEREIRIVDEAFSSISAFTFTLQRVGRWPQTAYLAPEPAAPFVQLTEAVVAAFPDYRPYAGKYSEIVPHLTVADGSARVADEAQTEILAVLAKRGPIQSRCCEVQLLENTSGRWNKMSAITLAKGSG